MTATPRNRLKIGDLIYPIIGRVKILFRGKECDGLFEPKEQDILVRVRLAPRREQHVLWHESIHAIEHQHGFSLPDDTVDIIAGGICQILEENPRMRKILK